MEQQSNEYSRGQSGSLVADMSSISLGISREGSPVTVKSEADGVEGGGELTGSSGMFYVGSSPPPPVLPIDESGDSLYQMEGPTEHNDEMLDHGIRHRSLQSLLAAEVDGSEASGTLPLPQDTEGALGGREVEKEGLMLRRRNSMESVVSNGSGSHVSASESWARRPLTSTVRNTLLSGLSGDDSRGHTEGLCPPDPYVGKPFEKPRLGVKNVLSLMSELAKNVNRLRDDLFVFAFLPATRAVEEGGAAEGLPRKKVRSESIVECEPEESAIKSKGEDGASRTTHPLNRVQQRSRGKVAALLKKTAHLPPDELPPRCESMLLEIVTDTSDPDAPFVSPFIDSRHTFLEMCQYRHYQFDTLRRAKHSTLLLLYHLQHAYSERLRPHCSVCREVMNELRWHCGQCDNHFDICQSCVESGLSHDHPLTPYRINFL